MIYSHAEGASQGKKVETSVVDTSWVLKGAFPSGARTGKTVRKVSVDKDLEMRLKPYQKEGVEFIWRNCFLDSNFCLDGDESLIGGCLLAHYMGLGKSLTTIALLHTALTSTSLVSNVTKKPLFHTVLLIAPANTLTNWENEVEKWTGKLETPLRIMNLGKVTDAHYRKAEIQKWKRDGGLLDSRNSRSFIQCEGSF
ncbi:Transcriptional regulator ATRX [Seminavis robusta]|uniref:Transcriptional regulator ATRX n=1 Tax=Seminavis robusta TaxID=568900 RepID=A0A9N8HQ00_9STRA|nr:Transcriptional regulator ATRX [Seminavis robusta]|eukprot:Sro1230_g254580.1 Transcriptional regulator ATRX (197) ;mRNA; r:30768-31657